MPRQDKLTCKYTIYLMVDGKLQPRTAIIDAPSLEAATSFAKRTYGDNVRVNELSRP